MATTQQLLGEIEPFLSVYDSNERSRQMAREPAYAQRLQDIYSTPTGASGYSYGRALSGKRDMLKDLAMRQSGDRAMGQVRIDLQKDADRRRYIANRANFEQQMENMRGKNIAGFTNLLTQAIGTGTAPIRPGGEHHGDFKLALEKAAQQMKNRQFFIDQVVQETGRLPDAADWQIYQDNPGQWG